MEKLKQYRLLVLMALVVLGLAFYWYSYRPSQIKIECSSTAHDKAVAKRNSYDKTFLKDDYDTYYKWCLEQKGL